MFSILFAFISAYMFSLDTSPFYVIPGRDKGHQSRRWADRAKEAKTNGKVWLLLSVFLLPESNVASSLLATKKRGRGPRTGGA